MELTLIFTLGEEIYGLEIDVIQEIIENPAVHHVPLAEGVLNGAINFHGQVLAVIDLPKLLGFTAGERDHRYVVLTPEFKSMVLSVSGVARIARLDLSSLQPAPAEVGDSAIRGVVYLEDKMVNLLDIDKVINQLENRYTE
jgi:purine-binding chemotaxis protein CheW